MPPKKQDKFVNPLLRPSEAPSETPVVSSPEVKTEEALETMTVPNTQTETTIPTQVTTEKEIQMPMKSTSQASTNQPMEASVETSVATSTSAETYTYSEEELEALVERRKRGKNAFDKTHERLTIWLLKSKKRKFGKLAKDMNMSQVELMDEALNDLFKKYRLS